VHVNSPLAAEAERVKHQYFDLGDVTEQSKFQLVTW
jgi:hypothetical protein